MTCFQLGQARDARLLGQAFPLQQINLIFPETRFSYRAPFVFIENSKDIVLHDNDFNTISLLHALEIQMQSNHASFRFNFTRFLNVAICIYIYILLAL